MIQYFSILNTESVVFIIHLKYFENLPDFLTADSNLNKRSVKRGKVGIMRKISR